MSDNYCSTCGGWHELTTAGCGGKTFGPIPVSSPSPATEDWKDWFAKYLAEKNDTTLESTRKVISDGWWDREVEILAAYSKAYAPEREKLNALILALKKIRDAVGTSTESWHIADSAIKNMEAK